MTVAAAPTPDLRPALVGREAEVVFLRRRLGEAALGRGSLTVISGEAGIGKTRLLEEAAAIAASRSLTVLRGGGAAGSEGAPCDLFTGVLAGLAAAGQRAAVTELLAETLPHLWPRVFADARGPDPGDASLPPELRQRLFLSRLVALLTERPGGAPLLVCLEDLHGADSASLQLFGHLARQVDGASAMVVATCRPPEVADDAGGLPRLLQEIHRHEHVHRLQLGPLSSDQTRALVSSCFEREAFSDDLFGLLHRRSGGLPLHALQLLSLFIERGLVCQEHGLWIDRRLDDTEVPASVREAIGKRLEVLSAADRDLLSLAAAQGTAFQGLLLAQSVAQSPPRTLKQLQEIARRSRLIQATPEGFRFAHPIIAEVLYQVRSEAQRRHVHLRLATLLERDQPGRLEALAHHLFAAGQHDRALPALVAAARRAIDTYAYREARALLDMAQRAAAALGPAADRARRLETLLLQAEVEDRLGDRQQALAAARKVLEHAADAPDVVGRALLQMAQVQRRQGQWREAEALYAQALDQFVQAGDEARAAKAQVGLGNLAFERSELESAEARFGDARDVALRLGDHALLGAIYGNLGIIATVRGDSVQAVLHYTEAIKCYGRVHHRYGICQTHHNLGMCYANQGQWPEALAAYGRGEELAQRLGTLDVLASIRVSKALALARVGRLDEAETTGLQAAAAMERLGDRLGVAECRKVEGVVLARRGQHDEARRRLEQGLVVCLELDNLLGAAECELELGLVEQGAGSLDQARSRLETAAQRFEGIGATSAAHHCRQLLAKLAA